jgi:hypothetical protein
MRSSSSIEFLQRGTTSRDALCGPQTCAVSRGTKGDPAPSCLGADEGASVALEHCSSLWGLRERNADKRLRVPPDIAHDPRVYLRQVRVLCRKVMRRRPAGCPEGRVCHLEVVHATWTEASRKESGPIARWGLCLGAPNCLAAESRCQKGTVEISWRPAREPCPYAADWPRWEGRGPRSSPTPKYLAPPPRLAGPLFCAAGVTGGGPYLTKSMWGPAVLARIKQKDKTAPFSAKG